MHSLHNFCIAVAYDENGFYRHGRLARLAVDVAAAVPPHRF